MTKIERFQEELSDMKNVKLQVDNLIAFIKISKKH